MLIAAFFLPFFTPAEKNFQSSDASSASSSQISSSSPYFSICPEEQLHLPLKGGVPAVCICLGSLHVSDLDLRHALASPLLLQTES